MTISTEIKCSNIGPLKDLNFSASSKSIEFGVLANNGSGKTFISRMFRLTENADLLMPLVEGTFPTDHLITFGQKDASFAFKVIDDEVGIPKEDFAINLSSEHKAICPETHYLFHVFNQDYVDENIRSENYQIN